MRDNPPLDLRERLMRFSLRIFRICVALLDTAEGRVIKNQLLRSGTSPGAQHREACRARSTAEFVSKMESAQQELDETAYWLELSERAGLLSPKQLMEIRSETDQLIAIFTACAKNAKAKR